LDGGEGRKKVNRRMEGVDVLSGKKGNGQAWETVSRKF